MKQKSTAVEERVTSTGRKEIEIKTYSEGLGFRGLQFRSCLNMGLRNVGRERDQSNFRESVNCYCVLL